MVRDSLRIAIGKYAEATAGKISSSQLLARQICSAEILQGVPNQKSLYCQEPQEPQDRHFVALFDKTEVCSVVLSMLQVFFLVQISPATFVPFGAFLRFLVSSAIGGFHIGKSCAFRSKSSPLLLPENYCMQPLKLRNHQKLPTYYVKRKRLCVKRQCCKDLGSDHQRQTCHFTSITQSA